MHGKPYFLFPDVLKRWSFQKNHAGIWSFLYYRERLYFFFPKIWSDTLDRKWKMIFLKKIHGNMTFSSKFLKRWSFQKGPRRDMIFLVLSGKMVFFSPKTWYFFLGQEVRDDLSQKAHGNMICFLCKRAGVTNVVSQPPAKKKKKKNQRWSSPAKIRLKMIEVLDWILERAPATFGWRHSTIINIQYIVPFSPHEMCLEVCLSANKGDYLSIRRWVIIPKM